MGKLTVKQVATAGVLIALGLVLPFLTMQIPALGQRLLPMHLPVLLGGFFLPRQVAGLVGLILPPLRSILFGMPPFFPTSAAMALELAAYGYLIAWLHRHLPRKTPFLFVNLILAMLGGRLVWGMVSFILYGLSGTSFTWEYFVSAAFWTALPGIVLQIIVIPALVVAVREARKGQRA